MWDTDELYDIKNDPAETKNLIRDAQHSEQVVAMKRRLFELLQESNGLNLPLLPDRGRQFYYRHRERITAGAISRVVLRKASSGW